MSVRLSWSYSSAPLGSSDRFLCQAHALGVVATVFHACLMLTNVFVLYLRGCVEVSGAASVSVSVALSASGAVRASERRTGPCQSGVDLH